MLSKITSIKHRKFTQHKKKKNLLLLNCNQNLLINYCLTHINPNLTDWQHNLKSSTESNQKPTLQVNSLKTHLTKPKVFSSIIIIFIFYLLGGGRRAVGVVKKSKQVEAHRDDEEGPERTSSTSPQDDISSSVPGSLAKQRSVLPERVLDPLQEMGIAQGWWFGGDYRWNQTVENAEQGFVFAIRLARSVAVFSHLYVYTGVRRLRHFFLFFPFLSSVLCRSEKTDRVEFEMDYCYCFFFNFSFFYNAQ